MARHPLLASGHQRVCGGHGRVSGGDLGRQVTLILECWLLRLQETAGAFQMAWLW